MGFFSRLFGSKKGEAQLAEKPTQSPQILRLQKRATKNFGQPQDRQMALASLAEIGTEEAIDALLLRYTFRIEQTIGDEEEKRTVYGYLIDLGSTAVDPIVRFLEKHNAPFWPTKALTEIVGEERTVGYLIDIVQDMEAIFDKDIERKVELISNLREFRDPRVTELLLGYLDDDNEEFRVHAVEGLADLGDEEMGDTLVERLLSEDETQRVKTTVLELLIDRKWKIKRHKEAIRKVIPDAYWIDDVGVIHRR
ncbi:MAG TPA: HEAT repeat domain-containing protein [Myxococcota bacterium]|nr:HEAT repeat domain-containing protein [Myxococcota bacterium]HQC44588.1 HEAT repeat domain-containing protein [Myxococcota bacterium]